MRVVLALALLVAACGRSKKPSTTPPPAQATEGVKADGEAEERDAARPDDADDMPTKAMDDPCAGGE